MEILVALSDTRQTSLSEVTLGPKNIVAWKYTKNIRSPEKPYFLRRITLNVKYQTQGFYFNPIIAIKYVDCRRNTLGYLLAKEWQNRKGVLYGRGGKIGSVAFTFKRLDY